jgi:hypothetical protein
MSKVGLVVENGKRMAAKASGLAALLAVEALSDPTLGPSLAFTQKMREIGHYPLDVFNHTGNFMVAAIGGFAASFMAATGQKVVSDLRGTAETVSLRRMDRVAMAVGLVGAAAASYTLEKFGGSVDMLDVAYSLGAGALGAGMFRMDREPVYDPNWRPPEQPQGGPEIAQVPQPPEQPPQPPQA